MKMKKVLSLMLAAALTLSLSACGGKDSGQESQGGSKEEASGSSQEDAPSEKEADGADAGEADGSQESAGGSGMQITEEPVTLTVLTTRWGNMGDSFTNNEFLQQLEAETNVHIEWQVQSLNDCGEP